MLTKRESSPRFLVQHHCRAWEISEPALEATSKSTYLEDYSTDRPPANRDVEEHIRPLRRRCVAHRRRTKKLLAKRMEANVSSSGSTACFGLRKFWKDLESGKLYAYVERLDPTTTLKQNLDSRHACKGFLRGSFETLETILHDWHKGFVDYGLAMAIQRLFN